MLSIFVTLYTVLDLGNTESSFFLLRVSTAYSRLYVIHLRQGFFSCCSDFRSHKSYFFKNPLQLIVFFLKILSFICILKHEAKVGPVYCSKLNKDAYLCEWHYSLHKLNCLNTVGVLDRDFILLLHHQSPLQLCHCNFSRFWFRTKHSQSLNVNFQSLRKPHES